MSVRLIPVLVVICVMVQLTRAESEPDLMSVNMEVKKLTSATSKFSQKMYGKMAMDKPNLVYSPYSAHVAFTMAYEGARGNTAEQMKTVLELSEISSPKTSYRDLIENFNSVEDVELLVANGLYINPTFTIKNEYTEEIVNNYHAKVENIDLTASQGPETPINSWVAQKTKNEITDILKPGDIDPDLTAMLIVNTLFFNGTWNRQFSKNKTRKSNFHKTDGSVTEVDLMFNNGVYPLKQDVIPGVDVLKMPFVGNRFSLTIALPKSVNGLPELESYIMQSPSNVDVLFEGLRQSRVALYLPKFKLTAEIDLKNVLIDMGMVLPFASADFSGISTSPLYISKAVQKATIEVREEGTVATAATVVNISARTMGTRFKADHPFMYFLRDDVSGQILFQGKLADPDVEDIEI